MRFRFCLLLLALVFVCGCIRVSGSAGYWKKEAGDAQPTSKQVGFDTQDWVPGQPAPGSIEVE